MPGAAVSRVILTVLDGAGIGALPDAAVYGDAGSDTLGNVARSAGGLRLPNLAEMGLGMVHSIEGVPGRPPAGSAGRMAEISPGKDTLTGHWEMAGLVTRDPIPLYPQGFPPAMIAPFERAIGLEVLGNKAASGTEIIEELGEEQARTGRPIVYTSADSVLQIAAHENVIPPGRLYEMCEVARALYSKPPYLVGRIIARPFAGRAGAYVRTPGRHDYSLPPPGPTLLEDLARHGFDVVAVGKVRDIFAGRGITSHVPAAGNASILQATIEASRRLKRGLVFANLVDFDMVYGHRNDPAGFAKALADFDRGLPALKEAVLDDPAGGVLVIAADHGCDPTTPSTDHSREYVPLLVEGRGGGRGWGGGETAVFARGVDLGTRPSFADLAAGVAELLGLGAGYRGSGTSFAAVLFDDAAG